MPYKIEEFNHRPHVIPDATAQGSGMLSPIDKVKLDGLGGSVPVLPSIGTAGVPGALRATPGSTSLPMTVTSGFWTANDGGGGLFVWDSVSVLSDDGGTIIQPTGVATGRWIRQHDGTYNPKWFGAKFDGVTDDQPAFQAMITALPVTGAKVHIPPSSPNLIRMNARLTIDKCVDFGGCGIVATRFIFTAGHGIYCPSHELDPGDSLQSHLHDFSVIYQGYAPAWQPSTHYNVGDVTVNTLWYGGFTYYAQICTQAGTSGANEPAWPARISQNQLNLEGTITNDGTAKWKSFYGAGIFIQRLLFVSRVAVAGATGDGIFLQGKGGGVGIADDCEFSNVQCTTCMGWGVAIEGSDAQVARIKAQCVGNLSGGIDDQCLNGNLFTACDCETNGIQMWGPNAVSQFPGGIGTVFGLGFTAPSITYMSVHPNASIGLFRMIAGFNGTSGAVEPVWPPNIGDTVIDNPGPNQITWQRVASFDRGQPYRNLDWTALSNSMLLECYMEPDQRFAHWVSPAMSVSAIGINFDVESSALIIGADGLVSKGMVWTNGAVERTNPLLAAVGADDTNISPMILAAKGINTSVMTDAHRIFRGASGKTWDFKTAGALTYAVAITGSPDPYGTKIEPGLLVIRPVGDGGSSPGSRIWWGSYITTDPGFIGALEPTHRNGDIILNTDASGGGGQPSAVPSGWINIGSGASPVWREFRFDYQRPIVDNSGGTVGSPLLIGTAPGGFFSDRGIVHSDINGLSSEAGYKLPVVGGRPDLKYHFVLKIGKGIKVFAQTGDKIGFGNQLSSAGGSIECTDRTGWLTVESIGSDPVWIVTEAAGTWTTA